MPACVCWQRGWSQFQADCVGCLHLRGSAGPVQSAWCAGPFKQQGFPAWSMACALLVRPCQYDVVFGLLLASLCDGCCLCPGWFYPVAAVAEACLVGWQVSLAMGRDALLSAGGGSRWARWTPLYMNIVGCGSNWWAACGVVQPWRAWNWRQQHGHFYLL